MSPLINLIQRHHLKIFFSAWLIIQLVQANYTELIDDEAYYWVYSRFPAWGYFDHPPMIAVLIKAGTLLFPGELGVRFFMAILNTFTMVFIYILLEKKNDGLFYLLACSMAILQIGGFLAVPDVPLCFFTALFFLCYKIFLQKPSVQNSILLGIIVALLLYSKYQGLLVIFFTLMSSPRQVLNSGFWLVLLISILFYFPHLYWQYVHNYPSIQFHLFERSADQYSINYTIEYFLGQLLLAGPITGWLVLWAAFKFKPNDDFHNALKNTMRGIYVFFLVCTIKGRVEANWTMSAFIPLIILSHQYLNSLPSLARVLRICLPVTLTLVFFVRIYIMLDLPKSEYLPKDEFHRNREWASAIKKNADGNRVVFINSYQLASKYWFYSGDTSFSLNSIRYRRNNYNFWPLEKEFSGKEILAISSDNYSFYSATIMTPLGRTGSKVISGFYCFPRINLFLKRPLLIKKGILQSNTLSVKIDQESIKYISKSNLKDFHVRMYFLKDDMRQAILFTNVLLADLRNGKEFDISGLPVNIAKGSYDVKLSLPSSCTFNPTINSTSIRAEVK